MIIYYVCAIDISNYDAQRTHILEVVTEMDKAGEDVQLILPAFHTQSESFQFKSRYLPVWLKSSKLKFLEYELRLFFFLIWLFVTRRPDIVYVRKGFLTLAPILLSRLLRIKCMVEVNGIVAEEMRMGFGLPAGFTKIFAAIEALNCRLSNKLITVTTGIKRIIMEKYDIDSDKIEVVSNGVNIEKFRPLSDAKEQARFLGFVGNLVAWAGLGDLIHSAAIVLNKYPDIKYLMVGDGVQRQYLEELAQQLGILNNFIFTGTVKPDEVPGYINRCKICFIPAIRDRNEKIGISPIKLYEYLACGVPVIVTDIAGTEIVESSRAGLVVEPENPQPLADATVKLLEDEKLRLLMARNARKLVEEHYSWGMITARLLNVARALIDNSG